MSTTTQDIPGAGQEAAQHELLRFAVANSQVIFYIADAQNDYTVRFISSNVASITGHAPDEFLADPSFGRRHLHPDDRQQFDLALDTLNVNGQASREYRLRSAQGRYLWFRDELKLADGGRTFVGSMNDISERVAAEAEREWLNQLMQDAIESLPSGFAVYDARDRVMLCNTAFARVYGRDAASMLGTTREENVQAMCRRLRQFGGEALAWTEQDVDWMLARLNDVDKGPVEMELDDGTWVLVSHSPTTDGGTVVVRTDISRQKSAEQALRASEEYFRRIVENHPLPVVLFDIETARVLYESPAMSALLRRGTAAGEGYLALEYFPDPDDRRRYRRLGGPPASRAGCGGAHAGIPRRRRALVPRPGRTHPTGWDGRRTRRRHPLQADGGCAAGQ